MDESYRDAPPPPEPDDEDVTVVDDVSDAESVGNLYEALQGPGERLPKNSTEEPVPGSRVYRIRSTSRQSAEGEDALELSLREGDEGKLTRRVIDYKMVENSKNPDARVEIAFRHMRRAKASEKWARADSFQLHRLPADKAVALPLDSSETLSLYRYLEDLFALAQQGIPSGGRAVRVVDDSPISRLLQKGSAIELLSALIAQHGDDEFLRHLKALSPNLAAAAGLTAVHAQHKAALVEFERHVAAGDWKEPQWYPFFKENQWIFGHGLAYQFLQDVQTQPHYGGVAVSGKGAQIGDNLMATTAAFRFSVLVEVKRPDTPLLRHDPYRAGVYNCGEDLAGGVAQLQTNCRQWATEASKLEANRRLDIETYEPKGILVIGALHQFDGADKDARARSFELFRRNLHNPEVVTFDELVERARFLVSSSAPPPEAKALG